MLSEAVNHPAAWLGVHDPGRTCSRCEVKSSLPLGLSFDMIVTDGRKNVAQAYVVANDTSVTIDTSRLARAP